jgi:hypothetical protein
MHCADFPRHLGCQITRCLIAHRQADTMLLAARWTAPDLASLECYSPLSEVGNSANRQTDERQGWPAKTRLGAAQAGREPLGSGGLVISRL